MKILNIWGSHFCYDDLNPFFPKPTSIHSPQRETGSFPLVPRGKCLLVPSVKHSLIFNPTWRSSSNDPVWVARERSWAWWGSGARHACWEEKKGRSITRYQGNRPADSPLPLPAKLDCFSPISVFAWIQMLTLESYPWSFTSLKRSCPLPSPAK